MHFSFRDELNGITIIRCGYNYGWNTFEGSRCNEGFNGADACPDLDRADYVFPTFEYCHFDYDSSSATVNVCGDRLVTGLSIIGQIFLFYSFSQSFLPLVRDCVQDCEIAESRKKKMSRLNDHTYIHPHPIYRCACTCAEARTYGCDYAFVTESLFVIGTGCVAIADRGLPCLQELVLSF